MGNGNGKIPPEQLVQLVEHSHFKKGEIKKIYKRFCKITSEGTLTREQFVTLYNGVCHYENVELLAGHLFRAFDLNNSFSVDFEEFIKCLSVTSRGTLNEQIQWIFRLYDIDGNGYVNISEIVEIMRAANIDQSNSQVLLTFKKMDSNNDGVLSLEEFTNESLNDLTFLRLIGLPKT